MSNLERMFAFQLNISSTVIIICSPQLYNDINIIWLLLDLNVLSVCSSHRDSGVLYYLFSKIKIITMKKNIQCILFSKSPWTQMSWTIVNKCKITTTHKIMYSLLSFSLKEVHTFTSCAKGIGLKSIKTFFFSNICTYRKKER